MTIAHYLGFLEPGGGDSHPQRVRAQGCEWLEADGAWMEESVSSGSREKRQKVLATLKGVGWRLGLRVVTARWEKGGLPEKRVQRWQIPAWGLPVVGGDMQDKGAPRFQASRFRRLYAGAQQAGLQPRAAVSFQLARLPGQRRGSPGAGHGEAQS